MNATHKKESRDVLLKNLTVLLAIALVLTAGFFVLNQKQATVSEKSSTRSSPPENTPANIHAELNEDTIPAKDTIENNVSDIVGSSVPENTTEVPTDIALLLQEIEERQLNYSEKSEDQNAIGQLIEQARSQLESRPKSAMNFYWRGRLQLLSANMSRSSSERTFVEHLEATQAAAEAAIQRDAALSDAYRIRAEALMQLIPYKGNLFAANAAPQAKEDSLHAIQLERSNARAHLTLGQYYLFTPPAFGGNLKKAIRSFQQADEVAAVPSDRFLAKMWLGLALKQEEQPDQAKASFSAALNIYPNSSWAKSELANFDPDSQ